MSGEMSKETAAAPKKTIYVSVFKNISVDGLSIILFYDRHFIMIEIKKAHLQYLLLSSSGQEKCHKKQQQRPNRTAQ